MRITNANGISLPLAVWLAHDTYDYVEGVENYISVTTLMKPIRQIVLPQRIPVEQREMDIEDFIPSTLGHAIHDSMEQAWRDGYRRSMKLLGYPDAVIDRIRINPTDAELEADSTIIPVYLEQRAMRNRKGYTIGGKYDMVAEGIVNDTKSTSAWAVVNGTRDDEHILQMSLYNWIDAGQPRQKITEDYGSINYIFTDWSKAMARSNPKYPQKRVMSKNLPLLTLEETEAWIDAKLQQVQSYSNVPEDQIPECTDEELWRSDPKFKYFSDPEKAKLLGARSTKNFDSLSDARAFMAEKGGKGVVITVPGEVKRCAFCPAFDACSQKDKYL